MNIKSFNGLVNAPNLKKRCLGANAIINYCNIPNHFNRCDNKTGTELCQCHIFTKTSHLKTILSQQQVALTIKRLTQQVFENHMQLVDTVLIGLQPRGIFVSDRMVEEMKHLVQPLMIQYGKLDITFYRDDVRKQLHTANKTDISFSIENKNVVLIDDVLWTGRTIRAAMDALLDFGRPAKVELCVLIDRRFSREYPIQADYVGRSIDTFASQKIMVNFEEGVQMIG